MEDFTAYVLWFPDEPGKSGPIPGVTGLGYSGAGGGSSFGQGSGYGPGPEEAHWERGANLKEYYARKDEQEAQAVTEMLLIPHYIYI